MHPLDFSTLLRLRDRDYVEVSVTDAHVVALLTKAGTQALRMVSRTGRDHPNPCTPPVTVTTTKMPAALGSERGSGAEKSQRGAVCSQACTTCRGIDGGRATSSAM
jgi:hypothetical protein